MLANRNLGNALCYNAQIGWEIQPTDNANRMEQVK
jgi:hypothetical protein